MKFSVRPSPAHSAIGLTYRPAGRWHVPPVFAAFGCLTAKVLRLPHCDENGAGGVLHLDRLHRFPNGFGTRRKSSRFSASAWCNPDAQLASWFDLDFNPRETVIPPNAYDDETTRQAWEYNVMPPANAWPWMPSTESGLNPAPTPLPPRRGLDVKMSTGPNAPRSHWQ